MHTHCKRYMLLCDGQSCSCLLQCRSTHIRICTLLLLPLPHATVRVAAPQLTLRAICDSFGVAVHVVTSEQRNWYLRYEPLSYKSRLEVFLTYIAPMHYNSLR